ncbi:cardiolipin synthase [Spirochaeta cellobiosiphila]|uniref:cardiolipin synthase n=1 Tax=Spirochaeta cellobiosiphila TaxID=504483 RepID=UPI000A067626|nr:cardiolipin synthase [Spirochaeta cellobiosiphila]
MELFLKILMYLNIGITIIAVITIFLEKDNDHSMISWLLAIFFLQSFGLLLYVLFGINWRKRKLMKTNLESSFKEEIAPFLWLQKKYLEDLVSSGEEEDFEKIRLIRMMQKCNNSLLTLNNQCSLFHKGEDFFKDLKEELKKAKRLIHMEFYIWRSDQLGEEIKDILLQKAAEGVEIRLLFDGWGSFGAISRAYKKSLLSSGIEYRYWLDISVLKPNIKVNYRNHRKIVVIDGHTAYTGGMNIGQEYISGTKRMKSWRDTQIKIEGEGVSILQAVFLSDWYNSGGKVEHQWEQFVTKHNPLGSTPLQVLTSGPDSPWDSIAINYFSLIANAKESVHIQTPYLVPDASLLRAMEEAAMKGVQVNLMMTGVPDKRIPYWVGQTYYERLLKAGVRIYRYTAGFLHSKYVIADSKYISIGSCNMDIRSLEVNFEANLLIFDETIGRELVNTYNKDLESSKEVFLSSIQKRPLLLRLRNSLFRIFSPIL